jgi:hypothetical protein
MTTMTIGDLVSSSAWTAGTALWDSGNPMAMTKYLSNLDVRQILRELQETMM